MYCIYAVPPVDFGIVIWHTIHTSLNMSYLQQPLKMHLSDTCECLKLPCWGHLLDVIFQHYRGCYHAYIILYIYIMVALPYILPDVPNILSSN